MQTNFNLLFFLKKKKDSKSDDALIFLRITLNGQRAEFSTGRRCLPSQWNATASKLIGTTNEVRAFNMYLDTLQSKIYEAHRQLMQAGETITAESLKNKYKGKTDRPRMVMEIFQDHNDRMEALLGDEYAAGTLERYKTTMKHTIEFMEWKYNISDIDIKKIDHAFLTDYEFYLRTVRKCNNNTSVKYIKNFSKIINICLKNGWLLRSPFINYSTKLKEVNRVYLTEAEIETIMKKKFATDRLSQIRDVFIFSCFTGLAYVDVANLKRSDINLVMNGEKWIFTKRQKTDTICNVPLLPPAEKIIQKYAFHPQCLNSDKLLPVSSNQKTNEYLKDIATLCGINKVLTFHIARHTFATTVTLTNGVSIESVSKMLGHKSIKTTQHYAKIIDRKVGDDMRFLKEKYTDKPKKTDSESEAG
jgi:site-specific recombinase XerD